MSPPSENVKALGLVDCMAFHRRQFFARNGVESVLECVSSLVNEVEQSLLYNQHISTRCLMRIDGAINNIHRISSGISNSQEIIDGLNCLKNEVCYVIGSQQQGFIPGRIYTGMY